MRRQFHKDDGMTQFMYYQLSRPIIASCADHEAVTLRHRVEKTRRMVTIARRTLFCSIASRLTPHNVLEQSIFTTQLDESVAGFSGIS